MIWKKNRHFQLMAIIIIMIIGSCEHKKTSNFTLAYNSNIWAFCVITFHRPSIGHYTSSHINSPVISACKLRARLQTHDITFEEHEWEFWQSIQLPIGKIWPSHVFPRIPTYKLVTSFNIRRLIIFDHKVVINTWLPGRLRCGGIKWRRKEDGLKPNVQ